MPTRLPNPSPYPTPPHPHPAFAFAQPKRRKTKHPAPSFHPPHPRPLSPAKERGGKTQQHTHVLSRTLLRSVQSHLGNPFKILGTKYNLFPLRPSLPPHPPFSFPVNTQLLFPSPKHTHTHTHTSDPSSPSFVHSPFLKARTSEEVEPCYCQQRGGRRGEFVLRQSSKAERVLLRCLSLGKPEGVIHLPALSLSLALSLSYTRTHTHTHARARPRISAGEPSTLPPCEWCLLCVCDWKSVADQLS